MTRRSVALQLVLVLSFFNVALAQSIGTFTPTGSMNVARFGHTATLLTNGKVLIAGGSSASGKWLSSSELYDPATASFTPTGDMTWPQSGHTATLLPDGKVLIVGGHGSFGSTVTADLQAARGVGPAKTPGHGGIFGRANCFPHFHHTTWEESRVQLIY
jgi:hypothetical protein